MNLLPRGGKAGIAAGDTTMMAREEEERGKTEINYKAGYFSKVAFFLG